MARMTGGQAVVQALKGEGVEVVFGLPGVHAMPLYDALYDQEDIRYIGVRHEQASAYMSDGYARATGRVGVCLTTTGPGAANTASAMGEAYASSSPVLQIATQISSDLIGKGKGALHESKDQLGLLERVAGWAQRVESVADIPQAIHSAMLKLQEGRPRPVVLEIPADILAGEGEVAFLPRETAVKLQGDVQKIKLAAEWLGNSQAPLIWAGGGVTTSGANSSLLALAEALQAPVLTTYQGKGAISEDHPLSLGNWGLQSQVRELLQEFLDRCDALLAIGTRFSALSTADWSLKLPSRLIQIDIDEGEMSNNYPAALEILGDAGRVLAQLLAHLPSNKPRPSRADEVADLHLLTSEILNSLAPTVFQAVDNIRETLERDAILVCDMTVLCYWASRHFQVYEPRTLLYPSGFGTLGFAFPAALGAKVAWPDRQVVALCGDGGFMFNCQELATAVQYNINLPVLLVNDGGYGILRDTQDNQYSGRRFGVDLVNPDFGALARAFGAEGIKVESWKFLGPTLEKALKADKPAILEIVAPLWE
ncbi:MAG: thiamine pyrophosphate-binding protein [Chloroflexi bacterium]|nr:thiamine pyrophosphate-binding protein [Chloroflexota bacterium]